MNPTAHDDIPIVLHTLVDCWGRHYRYALREDDNRKIEGLRLHFYDTEILSNTENYRNGRSYGSWYSYWDTGFLMKQETQPRPQRKTHFSLERHYNDTSRYIVYPYYECE